MTVISALVPVLILLLAAFLLCSWVASRPRGQQLTALGNVAEGFQPAIRTLYADAVIGPWLLVKRGSDARHYALAGVGDIPIGYSTDEPDVIGDGVAIAFLGLQDQGSIGVASAAIAVDDLLVPAANGRLRPLPTAAGAYVIVGRATSAAGAGGDLVEYTSTFPVLRVVTAPTVIAAPAATTTVDGAIAALNSTAVNPTKADFDALLAAVEKIADEQRADNATLREIHAGLVDKGLVAVA